MRCAGILSLSNFVGGVGACSSLVFELYAVSLRLRLFLVRRLILLLNCKSGQTHSTVLRLTRACLTRLLARARFLGLIRYNWPDSAETLFHALTYHGQLFTFDPELYSQKGNKLFLEICRPNPADSTYDPQLLPRRLPAVKYIHR